MPFPYTDTDTRQRRPALVISDGGVGPDGGLLWVMMITSAANRRWPDDVTILDDHLDVGLPAPSLVRTAKIATIEASAASRLGTLDVARLTQVRAAVGRNLGTAG